MSDHGGIVNPEMLILARESRGLSQRTLAEKLGITQGRLSKLEQGQLVIPNELLANIAEVLSYPPHFFYQEGTRMGVAMTEIFHRKRQSVPKGDLAKIYARMEIYLRHIIALLSIMNSILVAVQRFSLEEGQQPEEIARLVREGWKIPPGPIDDLTRLLECVGILVVPMDFETKQVDAISRWAPGLPPLMFINIHSPKDRYRYSLSHELGHIVMHALPSGDEDIEDQANRFAAEFLLPERDIRDQLQYVNLAKLAQLKRYWKVSMAALLMRAQRLNIISSSNARYLWSQMAKLGYKTHEPVELDVKGEQPTRLKKLIESYLKNHGSVADLGELFALNEGELSALYLREIKEPSGGMEKPRT